MFVQLMVPKLVLVLVLEIYEAMMIDFSVLPVTRLLFVAPFCKTIQVGA
jgi:hypothetical protein